MGTASQPYVHGDEGERYAIQGAVKTLAVLFAFAASRGPLTLSQITQRAGLPRNQVYRSIRSLLAFGVVAEDQSGFVLTPKVLQLLPAVRRVSLFPAACDVLQDLHCATGECVTLTVLLPELETVVLSTLPSTHTVGVRTEVGQRSGLHAGAVPKAILAFLPDHVQKAVAAQLPHLPSYTVWTVSSPEDLHEELTLIRSQGYAVGYRDFEEDACGVGAPIFGPSGSPIAGVSIGAPIYRMAPSTIKSYGLRLVGATRQITERIGGLGPEFMPPCIGSKEGIDHGL